MIKYICLFLLIATMSLPGQSFAQTPINNQMAQAYLNSCVKQPAGTMGQQTLTQFCQCTTLHIQKNMTFEEIQAQAGNDQRARNALNKVVTQVYAPCIQYPVRALVALKCSQNPDIKNPQICACSADSMATYTQNEAPKQLAAMFAKNPNIADPSTAFMSTPQFESTQKKIAEACVKKYQK